MCIGKDIIAFCTCVNEKSESRSKAREEALKVVNDIKEYETTFYSWKLERIIRPYPEREKSLIMGQLIQPVKRIDEKLNARMVLDHLNHNPSFDFDYEPNEGDQLSVLIEYKYIDIFDYPRPRLPFKKMQFVFEKEEWYFGYINHFSYQQAKLNNGKIKLNR